MKLFTAATANGNHDGLLRVDRGPVPVFAVFGTWDSASVQLQFSPDEGTTWLNVGTAITQNGYAAVALPSCKIRAVISSVGAGTSISGRILN